MFPTAAEMTADMDGMITDLPASLVWGAQTVAVVAGDATKANTLEMYGLAMGNGILCIAVISDFTGSVYPPVNALVTLDAVSLRVISAVKGADGVTVELQLDRPGA